MTQKNIQMALGFQLLENGPEVKRTKERPFP
jgi:hypothetical protein